jgi:hypothetical protein
MTTLSELEARANAGEREALAQVVLFQFVEAALLYGDIPVFGRSDIEILDAIRADMESFVAEEGPIAGVVDATRDLLDTARKFKAQRRGHDAILYYATWVEHWANDIVSVVFRQRHLPEEARVQCLREMPLRSKLTWLLSVLGLPALDPKLLSSVLRLADARNSFIHFKWSFVDLDNRQGARESAEELLSGAEALVSGLSEYASAHLKGEPRRLALLFLGISE